MSKELIYIRMDVLLNGYFFYIRNENLLICLFKYNNWTSILSVYLLLNWGASKAWNQIFQRFPNHHQNIRGFTQVTKISGGQRLKICGTAGAISRLFRHSYELSGVTATYKHTSYKYIFFDGRTITVLWLRNLLQWMWNATSNFDFRKQILGVSL